MPTCSIARPDKYCPFFRQYSGFIFGVDPATTPGTVGGEITELDLGTADVSGGQDNTDAVAVKLQFPTNTTMADVAYTRVRRWCYNKKDPAGTGHTLVSEMEDGALTPAVSLENPLAGTTVEEIPGAPRDTGSGNGPTVGASDVTAASVINDVDDSLRTLIVQLQVAAGSAAFNQANEYHDCPKIVVEYHRRDYSLSPLREDILQASEEGGHLYVIADAILFIEDQFGNWQEIGGLKTDSVEKTQTEEQTDWVTSVPGVVVHRARTTVGAMFSFQIDNATPALKALALQTTATRDDVAKEIVTKQSAGACPGTSVTERQYIIQFSTHGGFIERWRIPRGVLQPAGAEVPSSGDWSGIPLEVNSLAKGVNKDICIQTVSETPVDFAILPLTYAITV